MAWKDLSYDKKVTLSNLVSVACAAHNIEWLKKALPTAQDLLEYRDMRNGGGVLHTLMYAHNTQNGGAIKFLREIMKTYGVDKNPELKEALFMKRNANGKLAADFSYASQYMAPENKKALEVLRGHDVSEMTDLTDRRTAGEKNKVALYHFIKDQVLTIKKETTKEQAHAIIKPYQDRSEASVDQFEKGTPVSGAMYLVGDHGKIGPYMIGSAHEEYPEIRLRNFRSEDDKEDYCVLRGLRPDSSESLLSQAIDKIDFPEDYEIHFKALEVFEDDYKRLREDEGKMATYRYFTQNRGVVIFEGGQDKTAKGNSKDEDARYAGYRCQRMNVDQENGNTRKYPIVVVDSTDISNQMMHHEKWVNDWNNNERTLYHELFHETDLGGGLHFSEMPIFIYAMMLVETDKNNKITTPFRTVNEYYPPSQYDCEMTAQIMGVADERVLESSPLLKKVHRMGQCFAVAKANNNEEVMKYLTAIKYDGLFNGNFSADITRFRAAKTTKHAFELDEKERILQEHILIEKLNETVAQMEKMLSMEPQPKIPTQETFDNIKDYKDAMQVLKEYQLTEEQKNAIVHKMEKRAVVQGSYGEIMMKKIKELAKPSDKKVSTNTATPSPHTR